MSLDGWLSAIAPTVDLSYTEADHRLMQFTGISNIRDAHGKRQRVLIDFPTPDTQAMPTHAQVDAAANATLAKQCEGRQSMHPMALPQRMTPQTPTESAR
jgi:hypothetical protein